MPFDLVSRAFCVRRWPGLVYLLAPALLWAFLPSPLHPRPPGDTPLWETVERPGLATRAHRARELGEAPGLYRVDPFALETVLRRAPLESRSPVEPAFAEVLHLPMPDGTYRAFRIEESPILAPELAARFPEIRTYTLQGVDDPALSGRLSRDPGGVQALVVTPNGVIQVNPDRRGHPYYRSLWERPDPEELFCRTGATPAPLVPEGPPGSPAGSVAADGDPWRPLDARGPGALAAKANPSGGTLSIYRLAVATTGEYYAGRDGGGGDSDVLASVVAVINRVDAVYEVEVAIRFVLVAESDQILFDDPVTDGYSNNQPCTMRNENTPILNATIGSGAYDVGHVFGDAGGGGCAGGSVVCTNNNKGNGASGIRTTGDPAHEGFSGYRLVAHELGHQFGAGHTWSGELGSCTAGQFSANDAYEPLSGSTLMAYSGICGADNVQGGSPDDPYFHTRSFDEIVNFSTGGGGSGCALPAATGNSIPVVDAGPDYTIPRETPFVLTGSATDANDATLSYAWEQFDATPIRVSPLVDNGDNPLFRSFPPVVGDASRTFPQLPAILGYVDSPGELLPTGDRTLDFRLTARDNRAGGGGVDYDEMRVFVDGPPFAIVSPNGGETVRAGCSEEVLWDVGGGDVAAEVDLSLSTDGGFTYAPLETGVLNDGAESVPMSCTPSLQARVRADAVDNIFFDVSDANLTVQAEAPTIAAAATGGEVDDKCTFEVTFEATVTDDCSVSEGDVSVTVTETTGNATLGSPAVEMSQVDATTVEVEGSVLVSALTGPATVEVRVSAADGCGFGNFAAVTADVVDTTPPTIDAGLSPEVLWPPDHELREVTATVEVEDNCPLTGFVLASVTSDEPDDAQGGGDGHTVDDIQGADPGTADLSLLLRAERLGSGDGRVYTATYTAADGSGNETSDTAEVTVPRSRRP